MIAFDYDRQIWVDGPEAVRLRTKQVKAELDLLTGAKGVEYARFTRVNRGEAILALSAELARLEGGAR